MHKNKDTKSFTELRKYLLNGYFFDSLPRARFRTQSKVYDGVFLQKWFINGCFRRAFFHLEDRIKVAGRVRQVVVLYSNDCKRISLDGLNIGGLWL